MKIKLSNGAYVYIVMFIIMLSIITTYIMLHSSHSQSPWYLTKMNCDRVWRIADGSGITIAFIDSGLSRNVYKEYSESIIYTYNTITKTRNVYDTIGHGTQTITIACGNRKYGIKGIAPKARIIPILVSDEFGKANPENLSNGIKKAVDHGADVICLSIGGYVYDKRVADAINYARKKKAILVASAGDYSEEDLLFPASMPSVIAVSSQDKTGKVCKFSNYDKGKSVLIPGVGIEVLKLDVNGKIIKSNTDSTSASCAIMSGIIALALQVNRNITDTQLLEIIRKSYVNKTLDVTKLLTDLDNIKA